jgi:hypothetical protein
MRAILDQLGGWAAKSALIPPKTHMKSPIDIVFHLTGPLTISAAIYSVVLYYRQTRQCREEEVLLRHYLRNA